MIRFLAIFTIICFVLAAPAMIESASVKRFGRALLTSAFGVILPLLVFFLSAFLTPDSKRGCGNGWFDCFHSGKLWLTPLVLWATGSLYVREVCALHSPCRRSLIHGLFMGVLVASGCFAYGWIWVCLGAGLGKATIWVLVPLYLAVWFGFRWLQLLESSKLTAREYLLSFLGSLPFWITGVIWSQRIFESLPKDPPAKCFVVTAAAKGHGALVGPFLTIRRNGHNRQANRQLMSFWRLEAEWQRLAPKTHTVFRHIYNRVGPIIARRITSPWMADAVYVALKPAEWLARFISHLATMRSFSAKTQPGAML